MSKAMSPAMTKARWLRPLGCLTILVLMIGGGAWFVDAVLKAREAARSIQCESRLNQLHLAFHIYHDAYGCFPPAYIADADGKPMHSWRVLILPYIDQLSTYQQYRFDEPWNGPNNQRLAQSVGYFRCASSPRPEDSPFTDYVVVVGPGTIFPGSGTSSLDDITDGTNNTILAAEIGSSDIHWMEPRDLNSETMSFVINDQSRPCISGPHPNGPAVLFVDHLRAYRVDASVRPETLRAMTTIAGGEKISKDVLIRNAQERGIGADLAE